MLANGDYVIVDLLKVDNGDAGKADKSQLTTLSRNLSGEQGQTEFTSALTSLKNKSTIEVEKDNL